MPKIQRLLVVVLLAATAAPGVFAAGLDCTPSGAREELQYTWQLRGGLAWIAGFRFPTSGVGALVTSAQDGRIHSRLDIQSLNKKEGSYYYDSDLTAQGERTLLSRHGYSWDGKNRHENTTFDYTRRIAHVRKDKNGKITESDKPMPKDDLQDVLTGIYFLRKNAGQITQARRSEIFSDGKMYSIVFKPLGSAVVRHNGVAVPTKVFLVTAAPEAEKRWPGGLKVWLTDDVRKIPMRIELQRSFASLQLNLSSVQSCGLTVAAGAAPKKTTR